LLHALLYWLSILLHVSSELLHVVAKLLHVAVVLLRSKLLIMIPLLLLGPLLILGLSIMAFAFSADGAVLGMACLPLLRIDPPQGFSRIAKNTCPISGLLHCWLGWLTSHPLVQQ